MDSLRLAVVASLVAGMAATAAAAEIRVPQDVRNLKDALLTAQPGDRVIVTGGTWRNGRVLSAITLVGRSGATLSGLWEIQGAGATVEGFAVRDGSIEVAADGVTLRRNRFSAARPTGGVLGTDVTGLTLEGNRFTTAGVSIRATGAIARENRLADGSLSVTGSDTVVEDNVLVRGAMIYLHGGSGAVVNRNRARTISVHTMDDAVVSGNTTRFGYIGVEGDRILVTSNRVESGRGLYIEGDDAIVRENRVLIVRGYVSIRGDRALVTDNLVDNRATPRTDTDGGPIFYVHGAGPASILRNEVRHRAHTGMSLECDDTEIGHNVVQGVAAPTSIYLTGDRNSVHDVTLLQGPGADESMSSLVLRGDENVVADTTVEGAGYDGITIDGSGNLLARVSVERSGRCGITVLETSAGTGVTDCVVDRARWASLFVLGTDTTITAGSFTRGRKVDVLDLGSGTELLSPEFATKSESEAYRPYR